MPARVSHEEGETLKYCEGCQKYVGLSRLGSMYFHAGWCPVGKTPAEVEKILQRYEREEGKTRMKPVREHVRDWYSRQPKGEFTQSMPARVSERPPRVLSMDEYRSEWEPQGWQLIIIGPTSTWREDWGEWEAIRDIVQNALDEAEAYVWGYDAQGLWIEDRGRGFAVADFLLGPPKLKPDYARGKFGEGMKIASLALVRKGYSLRVKTVGRELWIVFLQQRVNGVAETLAAMWRPDGTRQGTRFHIIGYDGPAYEEKFAVNLPIALLLAEVPSPITQPKIRHNQLYRAREMAARGWGGVIYGRDIYMRDIKSRFTYNLWGFDMAPDRHGPKDETKLWVDMGRLWSGIDNVFLLEQFLEMVVEPPVVRADETHKIHMDRFYMGREPTSGKDYRDIMIANRASWQEAWRKVVGNNYVLRTTTRWDGMVKHLGYGSQSVQWGVAPALEETILTDGGLVKDSQDRLRETEVVPDHRLPARALVHLNMARKIATWFHGISNVVAAVIPPASDRIRTAGLYTPMTAEIVLHLETLGTARDTVNAMVHEIGHHIAYIRTGDLPIDPGTAPPWEDLQPAHTEGMTYAASVIVQYVGAYHLDAELKEATW